MPDLVREVSARADRRAFESLRALIRANRFDVVQTHQSKAGALGRIAARGAAPVIVHTVHMASFGPAYGWVRSPVYLALERWIARFTDKFVFVGAELQRRYLAAGIGSADRHMIVRSPIMDLESLIALRGAPAEQRERARAAIGVRGGRQIVLMVAALDRRKRHGVAIKALAPLLAEGRTELVIAGQGPEREALEVLCRRLGVAGSVVFLGFVDDVKPLYAAADVLVHTSTLEGVPQTVVQAVAAGVPVIATEVDGVREVVSDAGHVSVLPPDARGLLEITRTRLATGARVPAPRETVMHWLPEAVDTNLSALHGWMEARAGCQTSANDGRRVPMPLATAVTTEERATG